MFSTQLRWGDYKLDVVISLSGETLPADLCLTSKCGCAGSNAEYRERASKCSQPKSFPDSMVASRYPPVREPAGEIRNGVSFRTCPSSR